MATLARPLFALALASALALPVTVLAAGLVNINTADAAALDTLPGIGPTKAAAVIAYRQANGPFGTIEDIEKVKGIGPVTFSKLEALITVGPAPPEAPQPAASPQRSQQVQQVDTAHKSLSAPAQPERVDAAPTAPEAAAGAAAAATAPEPAHGAGGSRSTWLVGLLAVIAFAGGAFMIL